MTEREFITEVQISRNLPEGDMLGYLALERCRQYIANLETPRPDLEALLPPEWRRIPHTA
jgi:hypothetical protein